ncbi:hypothetical protein LTR36_008910 [Oleoguttula mirabilis]|uniref:Impact N-terminal domain-containing protein n=1 Tax=Oleoguttula mirabilis TaxID=1507867 RepID=A0AAV9J701_9PEZI|nr:hypothetical protein LTR36_008910 [Oleoguttula mirabilis]
MSQKRKHSPDAPSSSFKPEDVFRSEPIEDRTSTFIAYFSPTLPAKDLQSLAEFKSASHKILAYRKPSNQRSITGTQTQYTAGHDDDGEKYGGKRVEKVLESLNVAGACVVARWYGGVMLGPVRFTHMEDCARGAVQRWQEHVSGETAKKRRVEEEGVEKAKLVRALGERDRSIGVLRALAAGKETRVKASIVAGVEALTSGNVDEEEEKRQTLPAPENAEESTAPQQLPVSVQTVDAAPKPAAAATDYSTMPLDRLRALDKARDATLAFLLKRIDKAEADLAALTEPAAKPP